MKKQEIPKNGAAILRLHVFLHRIPQPAMPFPKQLFVAPPRAVRCRNTPASLHGPRWTLGTSWMPWTLGLFGPLDH